MKRFLLLAIVSLSIGQMSMAMGEQANEQAEIDLLPPVVKYMKEIQKEISDPESDACAKSCGCLHSLETDSNGLVKEDSLLFKCVMWCVADAYDKRGLPYHHYLQEFLKKQSKSTEQLESIEQPVAAE